MEGLAWLLLKMSVLLALTGGAFFALGWWLHGKLVSQARDSSSAGEIEQWKSSLRAVEEERDGARRQLADAEARAESAEREAAHLRAVQQQHAEAPAPIPVHVPAPVSDLELVAPQEVAPKPKAKAKPRARKKSKA